MDTPFFNADEAGRLNVSPQLWIYIVIATPLTGLTLLFWRWEVRRRLEHSEAGLQANDHAEKSFV